MTNLQLLETFELELNIFDALDKVSSSDIEYWLNSALLKYIKTRYSGINFKNTSFEQTQKRTDDLRRLLMSVTYNGANIVYTPYAIVVGSYLLYSGENQIITTLEHSVITAVNKNLMSVDLPDDYLFMIGSLVGIIPSDSYTGTSWEKVDDVYVEKYTDTIKVKTDTIGSKLANSLSEHHLHYNQAKPLEIQINDKVCFYTDGNYKVDTVTVYYLRYPNKIDLVTNPFQEYIDMPKHTHIEIVKLAVLMYLENKQERRYDSFSNEVNTME